METAGLVASTSKDLAHPLLMRWPAFCYVGLFTHDISWLSLHLFWEKSTELAWFENLIYLLTVIWFAFNFRLVKIILWTWSGKYLFECLFPNLWASEVFTPYAKCIFNFGGVLRLLSTTASPICTPMLLQCLQFWFFTPSLKSNFCFLILGVKKNSYGI